MQARQFIDIIQQPQGISSAQVAELELLVKEYPFFESAHLLYTKALHQHNAINYSKQLRKTAIVANSRTVLYELIHHKEIVHPKEIVIPETKNIQEETKAEVIEQPIIEEHKQQPISPVSVTNSDIKIIYVNTVSSSPKEEKEEKQIKQAESTSELEIIKTIENETEAPVQESTEEKLNKEIELEITKGIVQSYVETDIIKTPQLEKEENKEPVSFTDWLNKVKKEAGTIQITPSTSSVTKKEVEKDTSTGTVPEKTEKKPTDYTKKRQIIDKIIESEPGRIKLGNAKFFAPNVDAKQSLLENEHLVTETLAKIYALQGNISKAIRAYEILSLKFPQKSVYFASLIEKLKTNK